MTRPSSTRRLKTGIRTRKIKSPSKKPKRHPSIESFLIHRSSELMKEEEAQYETDESSQSTQLKYPIVKLEENIKVEPKIKTEEWLTSPVARSISPPLSSQDEDSIDVSPIKEPISPDLKRKTFRRCGTYYDQWKDKVFSKLPKKSRNKHMVLVKLLDTGSEWPESVKAYEALGVVFLSKAGSSELDSRTQSIRLLGRDNWAKLNSTNAIAKYLNYLNGWLETYRRLRKANQLNAAFECLVSATTAFFDKSVALVWTESSRMAIKSLIESWKGLMLKTDDELEIEPISRDGVEKMLIDISNRLPKSIQGWHGMGTLV